MQDGYPEAFHDFARAWYPRIVKWVRARTSEDKVMDYSQAIWIYLTEDSCRRLLRWRGYYAVGRANPNSLAAYLKKVTARRVIDLYRADNKHWLDFGDVPDIIDDDGQLGNNPLDTVEGEQIKVGFRGCFGELQRRDQRMLIMRWNGMSDTAIAGRYRMVANNVRQRRYQMVQRLRECLSHKLPAYFSHD